MCRERIAEAEAGMKRAGGALAVALFAAWAADAPSHAADTAVTMTTTPTVLELCPGGEAGRVLVVVRNTDTRPIRNVCLSAFTNGPVSLDLSGVPTQAVASASRECAGGVALANLASGTTLSRLITLKLSRYPATSPAVYLRADYQAADQPKTGRATAVSTLEVRAAAIPGADALKLEAKAESASLHENEKSRVMLTVSNGTSDTLKLSATTITAPTGTTVTQKGIAPPAIPPNSAVTVDYEIEAKEKILPGKRVGLIEVDAQTSCGTSIRRIASYDVTLGVFGQSDLLTTVGVPSLLLLPGFLILTLWMLLWRLSGLKVSFFKKSDAEEFFVSVKSAEFWLVAITFSLAMFWLAPTVTGVGYQDPYRLLDIAKLWGISLAIGLVLYFAALSLDRVLKARAAAAAAQRTLTSNDDVLTAIEKMAIRSWRKEDCRPVRSKDGVTPKIRGFSLWEEKPAETVWLIPQIRWTTKPEALGTINPANADSVELLLRQLREIDDKKLGTLAWAVRESGFNGPLLFKRADLQDAQGELVAVVVTE
jgi:hypothetical protein